MKLLRRLCFWRARKPSLPEPLSVAPETLTLPASSRPPTIRRDYTQAEQEARTGEFVRWYTAQFERIIGVPWSHVWGTYHEYCDQRDLRPLTEAKLRRDLRMYGVQTRRAQTKRRRQTVYDFPVPARVSLVA